MQMAVVAISGYVVAVSPPASKAIASLARLPRTARGAVIFVALVSIGASLFNWAIQPRVQRTARARARSPDRFAHGLSRGGRGGLSRHGRDVGHSG